MNIVALITGRGNNTLKDKNILPLLGKPLMSYPANAAKGVESINHFYVSSDDDKILNIGHDLGYKKIKRPLELGAPTARHLDVLLHAAKYMEEVDNIKPDILIVFLANSPTVKSEWIKEGIQRILEDDSISSVVPVYQDQDHHPYRAKRLNENGSLDTFFDFTDQEVSSNRQELEPCYFLGHNFWVLNMNKSLYVKDGQKPFVFHGNNIKPIVVDQCFDVHTKEDLVLGEKWIKENADYKV